MARSGLALVAATALAACGWTESTRDFDYHCEAGLHGVDAPRCKHRLTDHYLLRYGEGSGDYIVLAFQFREGDGSSGLIPDQLNDNVAKLGIDDILLVVQTRSGLIYVAPAHPDGFPDIVGPLSEDEFAARYPTAPPRRTVQ